MASLGLAFAFFARWRWFSPVDTSPLVDTKRRSKDARGSMADAPESLCPWIPSFALPDTVRLTLARTVHSLSGAQLRWSNSAILLVPVQLRQTNHS